MKFSILFILCFALTACGLFNHSGNSARPEKSMSVKIECIQNHMPMSSQSSYAILQFFPADSVFYENFKIVEVVATGSNSSWKASVYDNPDFFGKDLTFAETVARSFDPTIGGPYHFSVIIQFESGEMKSFKVENVQLRHVS